MKRALTGVLLLGLGLGCTAAFDTQARHYACGADAGAAQCPGGWRCNETWGRCVDPDAGGDWPCRQALDCGGGFRCSATRGRCFDPDAGAPEACAADDECGGGWRCAPSAQCVNPAIEGKPQVGAGAATATLLHPRLPAPSSLTQPRIWAAATAELERTRTHAVGWLTAESNGAFAVLSVVEAQNSFGWAVGTLLTRFDPRGGRSVADGDVALSVTAVPRPALAVAEARRVPPGITLHVALDDGGVRRDELNTTPLTPVSAVLPVRVDPQLPLLHGAVVAVLPTEWRLYSAALTVEQVVPNALRPAPRDLALVRASCGVVTVAATADAVVVQWPDAGQAFSARTPELRLRRTKSGAWVGWRELTGDVSWFQVPDDCSPVSDGGVLTAPAPALGRALRSFDLIEGDEPTAVWAVREASAIDGGQLGSVLSVHDGTVERVELPLPSRIATREASWPFSVTRTGEISFSLSLGPSLVAQAPLSLQAAPATAFSRDSGLFAATSQDAWQLRPEGWFLAQRFNSPADVVAAPIEGVPGGLVTRGGRLALPSGQVVLPDQPWTAPRLALARELRAQDAGVIVATHDDSFDVWDESGELPFEARLRPSPGFAIQSLALRPASDGGFAEGYLATEDAVFRVAAPTPRRWSATRVDLPGARPLLTWFEHGLPRALLEDGVVVGLTTRLSLSQGLADPVVAGARACGATWALTTDGLFELGSAGWAKVALPSLGPDAQPSRLFVVDQSLLVFARNGRSWRVERPGPCPAD